MQISDRSYKRAIHKSTSLLPRALRVPVRRALRARIELAIARRASLLIISHPKAGNTWLRMMISRLYQVRFDIPSDFTVKSDELALRDSRAPRVLATSGYYSYEGVVGAALAEDAPPSALRQKPIVLLARHPCDIAVSWFCQFAKRQSVAKQELINAFIENPIDRHTIQHWEFVRYSDIGLPLLIDLLNTWERRVAQLKRAIIVRYEDMREEPVRELQRITELMGETFTEEELANTAEWTSFEHMQRMERDGHFKRGGLRLIDPDDETTRKVRRGKVGGYRDDFSPEQVAELDTLVAGRLSSTFGYTKPHPSKVL